MKNFPVGGSIPATNNQTPRRADIRICLVLALLGFLVYNANFRPIGAGDTVPARYLPFNILRNHTLFMDRMANAAIQGDGWAFWIVQGRKDRIVSLYPVVAPAFVTPLYVPAALWLRKTGWTDQGLDYAARLMEKLAASFIASLSVALFYLLLRRRTDAGASFLLSVAYGFGTNTWMIGSQALWQHGMGELLVITCMLLVTGKCTALRTLAAGTVCALISFNRPPDAILAAALGLYGLWWAGRRAAWMVAGVILGGAPLLAYNLLAAGNIAGAYGMLGKSSFFDFSILPGLAGLLFSPGRGLFVFTPFLLFLPFALKNPPGETRTRLLSMLLCIAIVLQMLVYAKADWRAGASWGPRWLTDVLPLLVWMLAPLVSAMRQPGRIAFVAAVCVSVAIQAIGAFWYTGSSDSAILSVRNGPRSDRLKAAWDIRNTPFIAELRHPPASFELLRGPDSGYIDTVRAAGRDVSEVSPGTEVDVEGWALADQRTPAAVSILLTPAAGTKWSAEKHMLQCACVSTFSFHPRPDVNIAMHTSAATGWRTVLKIKNIPPGEYVLHLYAQGMGEPHPVAKRPFRILPAPPDAASITREMLPGLARIAEARLREDQQPAGYWITSHTASVHFVDPKREMNIYLTSMLVDILGPAVDASLEENLSRARSHLAGEIETNGLVRYCGRVDSPTIPSLGYPISPDTDDTALVWRITGGKTSLLPALLETLKSYRNADGLYRTWLAPPDELLNTDKGRPDIGVHMHLLLFLAKADPEAARALYAALQRAIMEDRIWIYYEKTPLVPILRQADLFKIGYPLVLPQNRLQPSVPGQEPWVIASRLIAKYETGDPRPSFEETSHLLNTLAGGDFASLRTNPPLIFNSDLKSLPRFYWSEDFGYALWLRLYFESTRDRSATTPAP